MAAVLMGGMVLAGCDDNVEILRDPDVRIAKGMTWAWRPMTVPAPKVQQDADTRPVVSRDVITPAPASGTAHGEQPRLEHGSQSQPVKDRD